MRSFFSLYFLFILSTVSLAQNTVVDFEDKSLPGPNSAYYGQDSAGSFTSRGANFNNQYTDFGGGFFAWEGFAYSNVVNTSTAGIGNQFAAYSPTGGDHSSKYGLCFSFNYSGMDVVSSFARLTLPVGTKPVSISLANTTYTALSMLNGDSFSKKFGGSSGNDPDFLKLTIEGRNASDSVIGMVDFYLADYRFTNNALDYIVSDWTSIDLSTLPVGTRSLSFVLTSSDVGSFGINTPSYFALDNLVAAVPEPSTIALLTSGGLLAGAYYWRRGWKNRSNTRRK